MINHKKKIAFFLPSLMAGGAEHVAVNLSRGFVEKGIHVDFLLVSPNEQLISLLAPDINIVHFKKSRAIFAIFCLVAYLRHSKPDAVVSFLTQTNIVAVFSKILARYKGKIFLTEHSSVSLSLVHQPGFKNKMMLFMMKLLYPFADNVVAVSIQLKYELEQILKLKNAFCIYNPVDTSYPDVEDAADIAGFLKPDQVEGYSIVAVGRLTKAKNFALLIKSFSQVRRKLPVILNIIGEGEERTNLTALIGELGLSDCVFLRGYSDKPKAWMRFSDLLVLSSSWEGFALVIAEALSMGTTVVSTNCQAGPAEILDHGKYGYLVPINDPDKMAETIIYALSNPFDPTLLKERAKTFSIPNISAQYLTLIFPDA